MPCQCVSFYAHGGKLFIGLTWHMYVHLLRTYIMSSSWVASFFLTNVTSICTHSHALWTNTLNTFHFFFVFSLLCHLLKWVNVLIHTVAGEYTYTDERTNVWLCNCAYEYDIQQYDFQTLVCYTVLYQIYVWGKPTRSCCARF